MDNAITMRFVSTIYAPRERVWEWITSATGIRAEMRPILRMTFPRGLRSLSDLQVTAGTRLFRSFVFLFGLLPIDYSDMTLLQLDHGHGFVEQSPMGSMRLWRHERRIAQSPSEPNVVILTDQLTFQPRVAKRFVSWFIRCVFIHRHRVLKANLDHTQQRAGTDRERCR